MRKYGLSTVFGLLLAVQVAVAQTNVGQCPTLVEKALNDLSQNCDALNRNSACYGYNRVDATFYDELAAETFSQPADRTDLAALQTITTVPLDTTGDFWGIAVLNVQANVPNTLPGQAVTFMLLGDVEIENAVLPENALVLAEPVTVQTITGANIRSAPSTNANLVGSVATGSELMADGLDSTGEWLRVLYDSGPGWINSAVINTAGGLSTLPTITSETRTPMQAFYFNTTASGPSCNEAPPSVLVIQGPNSVKVEITANGADITIGSTIVLRLLENNQMELIVIQGEVKLGNILVPAGFKITAPLSEDGKNIAGTWQNLAPLTEEDIAELKPLENLPPNLLHYPIIIPTSEQIQAALEFLNQLANSVGSSTGGSGAGGVDCTNFKPTSPREGLAYGSNTFYWDAAPGATSYQVNVYTDGGRLVGVYPSDGTTTNLVLDASTFGAGSAFTWEVVALINGELACDSAPIALPRAFPSDPTRVPPTNAPATPIGTEFPMFE